MLLLHEVKHGARSILLMNAKMFEMLPWSYAAVSHECGTKH
jgi:hypothetical protein